MITGLCYELESLMISEYFGIKHNLELRLFIFYLRGIPGTNQG